MEVGARSHLGHIYSYVGKGCTEIQLPVPLYSLQAPECCRFHEGSFIGSENSFVNAFRCVMIAEQFDVEKYSEALGFIFEN